MTGLWRWAGLALLATAGCSTLGSREESDLPQVPTGPLPPSVVQTVQRVPLNTAPASQDVAWRVDAVGRKLIEANPQVGLKPHFTAVASADRNIFHRDLATVYITENLVHQCHSEAELAAVLAGELGRMVSEREGHTQRETRAPEPRPPIALPIGNMGNPQAADPSYFVELAKFDKDHPRSARNKPLPLPDPQVVAGMILERAGYQPGDLNDAPVLDRRTPGWRSP
jgi:hypothetical protein